MRLLVLAAGAALTLSACSGGGDTAANNEAGTDMQVENLIVNDPAAMNGATDMNALGTDMNAVGTDMNGMVANDLTTNEADTNTANGL